jgi:DNA-binding response OmpR family regulator
MIALSDLTLLYIEDEPLTRDNAVEYLSRHCQRVYAASDGVEGLALYHAHHPDIIITDIQMPRLDGLSFATKIRQEDKTTPIIITTAHTDTAYLLQAVELQLVKYLIKPVTAQALQEALSIASESLRQVLIPLDTHREYDIHNQTLLHDGEPIKLTHNELLLFDFLIQHRERTLTYAEIESLIWAYEGMSMDALRSLVRSLRQKLGDVAIENVSGVGYRLIIDF